MKPTILLDQDSGSTTFMTSLHHPVTLFQTGLTTGDKVELQVLTKEVDLEDAVDGDWDTLKRDGADLVLDDNNNYHVLEGPLQLRIKVTTGEATWRVGMYE